MMAKMDLKEIMSTLPSRLATHSPRNAEYAEMKAAARRQIEKLFDKPDELARFLPPFGLLQFPYFKMGATDSISLFDLDELIIFSFYWTNRHRYRRVLDIGANIGLHSIVLSKCGFEVQAYEPDPKHFEILEKNLAINGCAGVTAFNRAVSNNAGTAEFVRVLGNTTGSHIAGSKPSPYGELERFPVQTENIRHLIDWPGLIKMDVEGHEKELLLETTHATWLHRDALVEIGSEANAAAVFEHFRREQVRLFSQKIGWNSVDSIEDMPFSYRDGTLFVTSRPEMPWGQDKG